MKKSLKLISYVIPCYNEEINVVLTYTQLKQITDKLKAYNHEFIFVDNCSLDRTREKIQGLSQKDRRVSGVFLSRNFGQEASGLAGLDYAKGDAVITTVCDLQDPLELIPKYIREWEKGFDIVMGMYTKTQDATYMAILRKVYYKFFKAISNIDIPVNSSGICLFGRNALDGFLLLKERLRSNVGLRSWIGFKTTFITYERRQRMHGKSSYNLLRYLQTAERGFFGFSYLPLDSIIYIGVVVFGFSLVFLVVYTMLVVFGIYPWNIGTGVILVIALFGGIQLLALSIIGKYIQVIVEETKQRPHYIIDKIITYRK